jgi:hypothetical protein
MCGFEEIDFGKLKKGNPRLYRNFTVAINLAAAFVEKDAYFQTADGKPGILEFADGRLRLNGVEVGLFLGSFTIISGKLAYFLFGFEPIANASPKGVHFNYKPGPRRNELNALFFPRSRRNTGGCTHPRESAALLVHELAHVVQIRRTGIARFYFGYLTAFIRNLLNPDGHGNSFSSAYMRISYEREARDVADRFRRFSSA